MIRTCEFTSCLHPDKLCDQISDTILDECLKQDPNSRVAVETMGGHGIITVTGEITTNAYVDIKACVESVVGTKYGVQTNVVKQSPDIAKGVDTGGAGDQGIMVGYACKDTDELMPLEYSLARSLCKYLYSIHPRDGKVQITTIDDKYIQSIVASWHGVQSKELAELVSTWKSTIGFKGVNGKTAFFINPAGDWEIGGFDADTGVTGRKIVIDAYGPRVQVGGGAYSGKDCTKVDRSAAFMARKIAVDYLKKIEGAKECRVELAYAIGKKEPVMATAVVDGIYLPVTLEEYDLSPEGIINFLDLKKPQFHKLSQWGHYGNCNLWDK